MHGLDFIKNPTVRMRASGAAGDKILVQEYLVKFWIESDLAGQKRLPAYDHARDREKSLHRECRSPYIIAL